MLQSNLHAFVLLFILLLTDDGKLETKARQIILSEDIFSLC